MTLIQAAQQTRLQAYAPYSNYLVGAALEDEQGRIFTGINVENVSYGASICAERTAIVKMVSEGGSVVRRIAVATKDGGAPCGICLQVLLEFAEDPTLVEIVTINDQSETQNYTLAQLIPFGFRSSEVRRT